MKKNTCNVVMDLMPLYVDDILSEESKELVEEHLATCPACQEEYRTMSTKMQIPMDINAKPLKKVKMTIIKRVLIAMVSMILLCMFFLIANFIIIPMDYEKYDLKNTLKVTEKADGLYLVCMGGTSASTYLYILPEKEEFQEVGADGKQYIDYYVYIESALINQLHISSYKKEHYRTDMVTEDSILTSYKRISKADEENKVTHRVYYRNVLTEEEHLIWENPNVK